MRFYEFSDLELDEGLAKALDAKKKQLDNQKKAIDNRRKILNIQKAQKANRNTVKRISGKHLESE